MTDWHGAGELWSAMNEEVEHAINKHGGEPWSRHEFFAILKEEVDELWDAIKRDLPQEEVLKEASQVAAMVLRYAVTGDRHRGSHPTIRAR